VPLEVEGVVEALVAEGAQVALDVAVVLHVAVHEPLQLEALVADLAPVLVLGVVVADLDGAEQVGVVAQRLVLGVLDAEAAVDDELGLQQRRRRQRGRVLVQLEGKVRLRLGLGGRLFGGGALGAGELLVAGVELVGRQLGLLACGW
jgi:hypothetical protein